MTTLVHSRGLVELVRRLDDVVRSGDDESRCRQVKQLLSNAMATHAITLDSEWLKPAGDRYARRLLHLDRARRYSVLAMVWDQGQGTALHDHGGTWCVECVYQGRIEVTSYSVRGGDPDSGVVQFTPEHTVIAGVGEAGALIPPFEYHILKNAGSTPAVTLHVYGGELNACHIYEPVEGGWRRRYRELTYTQ